MEKDRKPDLDIAELMPVVTNENLSEDLVALKALFELTLELRNFEISQLVQRNNFFMIFQGVLFAGVVQSSHTKPVVSFLVCLAGLIVSVYQKKMAAGAKFWQDYWQEALTRTERLMLAGISASKKRKFLIHLFHQDEAKIQKMVERQLGFGCKSITGRMILKKYSVSQIPIYVAISLSLIWLFLVLSTLRGYPPLAIPSFITGF